MDKRSSAALALVGLALIASVAIVAGGSGWTTQTTPSEQSGTAVETTRSNGEVGLAVARGGPTCLDETVASRSGWVHLAGSGENAAVSFDITAATDTKEDVNVTLSNRGAGDYVLRITTDERASADATASDSSGCESVYRLEGSGLVPNVETLRVIVNGETVRTIEKRDSFAELRALPEPITTGNATTTRS